MWPEVELLKAIFFWWPSYLPSYPATQLPTHLLTCILSSATRTKKIYIIWQKSLLSHLLICYFKFLTDTRSAIFRHTMMTKYWVENLTIDYDYQVPGGFFFLPRCVNFMSKVDFLCLHEEKISLLLFIYMREPEPMPNWVCSYLTVSVVCGNQSERGRPVDHTAKVECLFQFFTQAKVQWHYEYILKNNKKSKTLVMMIKPTKPQNKHTKVCNLA